MKSLFFSLSGVLAFALGVLVNLELILPSSMVQAAAPRLPFTVEFVSLEQDLVAEGLYADGAFFLVKTRIINRTAEDRLFPLSTVIMTDGQAETIGQHARLQRLSNGSASLPLLAPYDSCEYVFCFDVPSRVRRPRLELEAAAFAEPDQGLVLDRLVLVDDLSGVQWQE
jgi:hypothetical protein